MKHFLSFGAPTLLFVAAVWADSIRFFIGIDFSQELTLMLAVAMAAAFFFLYSAESNHSLAENEASIAVALFIACSVVLLFALLRGYSLKACTLAYAPVVAFFFALVSQKPLRIIVFWTLMISLSLQFVEVATGHFTYTWLRDGFSIDERLMGGATGVFRSKGLFAGPTSATAYAILCALLLPRSWVVAVAVAAVSVMSGSKSGLLFLIVAGMVLAISGTRRERFTVAGLMLAVLIIFTIFARTETNDPLATQRSLDVFSIGAGGNESRFYFWDLAWSAFLEDFSDAQRFLGWPRGSRDLFFNSTESQYLQILLDLGVVGLSIYAVALVLVARRVRFDRITFAAFIGFTTVAAVTPLFDQSGLCILFWIFVFRSLMFPLETVGPSPFDGVRQVLAGLLPARRMSAEQ